MTNPTPPLMAGFAFEVEAVVTHPDGSTDQPQFVGENGPEPLVPKTTGRIVSGPAAAIEEDQR